MTHHFNLGKQGERIALQYLLNKGYIIHEKNWRYGKIEVDLIAEKDERIVFVEVKTRSTDYFGEPEEAVDRDKEQQLINGAQIFINKHELEEEIRFDIISIILNTDEVRINHIEDAFTDHW
ncbi:MAG: YraN family protein [Bacteroidetes bacterium]|nr:YraN family protein [Bacteroidota bacterium]